MSAVRAVLDARDHRAPTPTAEDHEAIELAAVARVGGRALTQKLAQFRERVDSDFYQPYVGKVIFKDLYEVGDPLHPSAEAIATVWANSIDPAGGRGRDSWRWMAERDAKVGMYPSYSGSEPSVRAVLLENVEKMFDWPIYRIAILSQQRETQQPITYGMRSTLRGVNSQTLDLLDQITPWFAPEPDLTPQDREDVIAAIEEAGEDLSYRAREGRDYDEEDMPDIEAKLARWDALATRLSTTRPEENA